MWTALALAVGQRAEPAPGTPFDRVVPLEIRANDPILDGHGPSTRIRCETEFSGSLHIWTSAPRDVDLFLRVEGDGGQLVVEDDSSGGGNTPYAMIAVGPGQRFSIHVALPASRTAAAFELHTIAAPETQDTRDAGLTAMSAVAEIKRLREARDFDAAQALARSSLEGLVGTGGATTSQVIAMAARELGREAYELSAVDLAVQAWSVTLAHRLRTVPRDHVDVQRSRGNLAIAKYLRGDLDGARVLQEQMLDVCQRILPADHDELQGARMNLAITLEALGDLERARELEQLALEVRTRTLPADDPNLQWARGNLGLTLKKLGDLYGARALFERVVDAFARTRPDDDLELQKARGNLAGALHALGDLDGARVLEEEVLDVLSRTLPDEHRDLQTARMNLASTLLMLGEIADARALLERVADARAREFPGDHIDVQMARSNLAAAILLAGDVRAARDLFTQVLEVQSRTLPPHHPDLQTTRQDLADTLRRLGELKDAVALGELVLDARTRTLSDDHPRMIEARLGLTWTLAHSAARSDVDTGAREAARIRCADLVAATCAAQTQAALKAIVSGSGREATARCERMRDSVGFALSAAAGFGVFECDRTLERAAFTLAETSRGAALGSAALMRRAASDPRHSELRAELRARSYELAQIVQRGSTSDEFQHAVAAREAVERELIALARDLSGGDAIGVGVDAGKLAATLSEQDALVCFWQYVRTDIERAPLPRSEESVGTLSIDRSEPALCAFVVRRPSSASSDAALTRIELGSVDSIEEAVGSWRASLGVGASVRGVSVAQVGAAASSTRDRSRALRRLVFDPLRAALDGAHRVIFVLDDVLHLVPMDALIDGDAVGASGQSPLLGDRFSIETRITAAELLADSERGAESDGLLVIGGVAYDAVGDPVLLAGRDAPSGRVDGRSGVLRDGTWSRGFTELPATLEESRSIAHTYSERSSAGAEPTLLEGADATRERFVSFAPKMRWLHVATHGWFAPESIPSWSDSEPIDEQSGLARRMSSEEQVKGMSPMLLCGLALAGANLPENSIGRAPGLITADELSTLDLTSCELAVLSACDTNVGERRAGQGVASMQRALQMAGARSVITSLWKVPDEATKELMLDFYRRLWREKKPKSQALWEAKSMLRNAKDERGDPKYTTRDWAAWVLTGEPD
jgi:CHAT domain-containing protein/tetratricopeptide (TPR) repeat protein